MECNRNRGPVATIRGPVGLPVFFSVQQLHFKTLFFLEVKFEHLKDFHQEGADLVSLLGIHCSA